MTKGDYATDLHEEYEEKKLCLIIPSLHTGGMERVMSELACYFCQNPRLQVHLVMYGIKPEVFYQIPIKLNLHTPSFRFQSRYRLWYIIKTILYLRKEIKKIQPDSTLSFGEYWNSLVLLALFRLQYPVYVSDRCQPNKSLGKLHDLLRRFFYPHTAGVIVQTKAAKEIYQRMLPKSKLRIVGNPIRQISTKSASVKENIVLSVGRLIKSKHHYELIKLFVEINMPDWKLIIVGDDALKQQNMVRLQTYIKELNAEDKVTLTGSQKDVDTFYIRSKIFAFTSSSEGFPNAIGEAMSAGLPVVAFDCVAGPSEMIDNDINGILVPVGDYDLFKKKLEKLMTNKALRTDMGQKARERIMDFSVDKIGFKYLNVLMGKA